MNRFFDSKPGSIRCASRMLRIKSPAPTSATSESAISETTSRLRKLFLPQPSDPPRPPSLSVSITSGTNAFNAGATPKSTPVNNEMPMVNSKTCESDRKSTRLNSSHLVISYAVFCLKKKKHTHIQQRTLNTVLFKYMCACLTQYLRAVRPI